MEKLILVFYINVNGMSRSRAEETLANMIENFKPSIEDNILHYLIPTKDGETRVLCDVSVLSVWSV